MVELEYQTGILAFFKNKIMSSFSIIRFKYYTKTVVFGIFSSAVVISTAAAALRDEISLHNRTAEIYDRISASSQPLIIDVNSASVRELQKLSGIGEVTARAIVAYRGEHGDFASADDLLNVKGIGQATLEKIRPYITVDG